MPFDSTALPRPAQLLLYAATLVERGHYKGNAFDCFYSDIAKGAVPAAYCAYGALIAAQAAIDGIPLLQAINSFHYNNERNALFDGVQMRRLIELNDAPGTAAAEVAARLRTKAATFVT